MNRVRLAEYVAHLVGREDMELEDVADGWPSFAAVRDPEGGANPIAMYLASVGGTQRGRDDRERRIQVKGGTPIRDDGVRVPLLLGVWFEDPFVDVERPVFVAADAARREGQTTQVSVFVPLARLQEAAHLGWSTYQSSTGEVIECLVPELLAVLVAARRSGVVLEDHVVQATLAATWALDDLHDAEATDIARTRRATHVLVRDARFAMRVLAAYDGCCAMCGLGMGISEAAHILPVGAAADDSPRNGLALCPNHHRLFDKHLVGVHPDTREIVYHPEVLRAAHEDPEVARVVQTTFVRLQRAGSGRGPRTDAFLDRYLHFEGRYYWLGY